VHDDSESAEWHSDFPGQCSALQKRRTRGRNRNQW
jgi:hypothetical protein